MVILACIQEENALIVMVAVILLVLVSIGGVGNGPSCLGQNNQEPVPVAADDRLNQHSPRDVGNGVFDLRFSPDGSLLAAKTRDQTIHLYDWARRRTRCRLEGHDGFIKAMQFHSNRDQLLAVVGGDDGEVLLWDTHDGARLARAAGGGLSVGWIADEDPSPIFSETADHKRSVADSIWVLDELYVRRLDARGPENEFQEVARGKFNLRNREVLGVAPGGDLVAVMHGGLNDVRNLPVTLIDIRKQRELELLEVEERPRRVYFSGNSQLVAACYLRSGQLTLWDLHNDDTVTHLAGHDQRIDALAFSPDHRLIATGAWDRAIKIWDCLSGRLVTTLQGHAARVTALAFSPDGRWLASGAGGPGDCSILLWDLNRSVLRARPGQTRSASNLPAALWGWLGDEDPGVALSAVASVAKHYDEFEGAVQRCVEEELSDGNRQQIQRSIRRLNSSRYQVRRQAFTHLLKARRLAATQLQEALRTTRSAEVRAGLQKILAQANGDDEMEPSRLRSVLRLIHALERTGNRRACQLLRQLAEGHCHSGIATVASQSLQRIE